MSKLILLFIQIGIICNYSHSAVPKKIVKLPPDLIGPIFVAVQKCQPETGVGADVLLLIYDGRYREDDAFKNFVFCTYKAAGFLTKDGHINEDKAIEPFRSEPLVEEGVRRCGQQKGPNAKESLFKFFKCFIDTTPVRITL